jgi:hypothetical protein
MTLEARSRIGLHPAAHREGAAELRGVQQVETLEARSRIGLQPASHREGAAELRGGDEA